VPPTFDKFLCVVFILKKVGASAQCSERNEDLGFFTEGREATSSLLMQSSKINVWYHNICARNSRPIATARTMAMEWLSAISVLKATK
jgi:hypothetical protein